MILIVRENADSNSSELINFDEVKEKLLKLCEE